MLTSKQISANQRRTMQAMIRKIEKMAGDFADVDNWMAERAENLKAAAENYLGELEENLKGE